MENGFSSRGKEITNRNRSEEIYLGILDRGRGREEEEDRVGRRRKGGEEWGSGGWKIGLKANEIRECEKILLPLSLDRRGKRESIHKRGRRGYFSLEST